MIHMGRYIFLMILAAAAPCTAGWVVETVDSEHVTGLYTSIALDSSGHPHITYYDQDFGNLRYARWGGSTWHRETVDSVGDVGQYTALALTDDDIPKIAYHDVDGKSLKYAFYNVDHWVLQTPLALPGRTVGWYTNLYIDPIGRPHIGCGDTHTNSIAYVSWVGTGWHYVPVGYPGHYVSMTMDTGGDPHFCSLWPYSSTRSNLYYFYRESGVWHDEVVADEENVGIDGKIGLDREGLPFIIHYEDNAGQLLMHRRLPKGIWVQETVDAGPGRGEHLSMAQDVNSLPHLAYLDQPGQRLVYARHVGTGWQSETVDTGYDMGMYTSMALDSAGHPHISYCNGNAGHLKYAHWEPTLDYAVVLIDPDLRPGDDFNLRVIGENATATVVPVDEYIILDVLGYYWFWPGWTQAVDSSAWTFGIGEIFDFEVLRFDWPSGAGAASGLRFWAGLLHQGTLDVIVVDWVDWGFGE